MTTFDLMPAIWIALTVVFFIYYLIFDIKASVAFSISSLFCFALSILSVKMYMQSACFFSLPLLMLAVEKLVFFRSYEIGIVVGIQNKTLKVLYNGKLINYTVNNYFDFSIKDTVLIPLPSRSKYKNGN